MNCLLWNTNLLQIDIVTDTPSLIITVSEVDSCQLFRVEQFWKFTCLLAVWIGLEMVNNVHALFSQILVVGGYACNC